jgi:hypothetical protein
LLELAENDGPDCARVDALARDQIEAIERRMEDLGRLRDELSRILTTCEGGSLAECRIIDALSPAGQWR